MLTTTKRQLRNPGPNIRGACHERYKFLCTWAPEGDDDPISLLEILDNNGFDDALWALRACDGSDGIARWFARWCALTVRHLWEMPDVAERYLRTGDPSLMDASWAASCDASWDSARSAQSNCLRRLLNDGIPTGDITDEIVEEYGRNP